MIIKEIQNIISNPNTVGKALNDLTDQFRKGRDPWEILELLNSKNEDVIGIGLYIANEIIISDHNLNQHLKDSLSNLINQNDSNIRIRAFLILSQIYTDYGDKEKETDLHLIMIKDKNKHISEAGAKLLKDGHLG